MSCEEDYTLMQGATDAVIQVTIVEGTPASAKNISLATVKQIIVTKPDGTKLTKDADFTSDGSDGNIQFVSLSTDFDQWGWYRIQGYVSSPSWTGHSVTEDFEVGKNL